MKILLDECVDQKLRLKERRFAGCGRSCRFRDPDHHRPGDPVPTESRRSPNFDPHSVRTHESPCGPETSCAWGSSIAQFDQARSSHQAPLSTAQYREEGKRPAHPKITCCRASGPTSSGQNQATSSPQRAGRLPELPAAGKPQKVRHVSTMGSQAFLR